MRDPVTGPAAGDPCAGEACNQGYAPGQERPGLPLRPTLPSRRSLRPRLLPRTNPSRPLPRRTSRGLFWRTLSRGRSIVRRTSSFPPYMGTASSASWRSATWTGVAAPQKVGGCIKLTERPTRLRGRFALSPKPICGSDESWGNKDGKSVQPQTITVASLLGHRSHFSVVDLAPNVLADCTRLREPRGWAKKGKRRKAPPPVSKSRMGLSSAVLRRRRRRNGFFDG